jgi:glycosyltransferase involved in cell wall biosynthesis
VAEGLTVSEPNDVRVSIVTATFNSRTTIADALESVASQTYPHIDHVVIDGMSSDGTFEYIREHGARVATLVHEPDRGIYDALNKGILHARGDVVGFLHADDVFAGTDVVEKIAEKFRDPSIVAVYGDLQYVDRNDIGRVIRDWRAGAFDRARLAWGWMPPHPTFYLRRAWYEHYVGFDTSYEIAADYEHMLRTLTNPDCRVAYLPEVLVKMRLGGASNRSLGNIARKSFEDLRALREHRVGALLSLVAKNLRKLPQFFVRR